MSLQNGGDLDCGSSNLPLRGDKGDLWEGGTKSVGLVYSPKYLGQSGCIHHGWESFTNSSFI